MQVSLSQFEYQGKKRKTRRNRFLAEIEAVVPWATLTQAIEPFYPKGKGRGRPPIGLERIFESINEHLAARGLMLREGTVVDASIIAAPPSTKNRDGKRDPEMHQTKKGNQWHFGMKAHIGVDAEQVEQFKASIRAKIEHPFHIIKNRFGLRKVRYRGLFKNTAQLYTLFALANLLIAGRHLVALHARDAPCFARD